MKPSSNPPRNKGGSLNFPSNSAGQQKNRKARASLYSQITTTRTASYLQVRSEVSACALKIQGGRRARLREESLSCSPRLHPSPVHALKLFGGRSMHRRRRMHSKKAILTNIFLLRGLMLLKALKWPSSQSSCKDPVLQNLTLKGPGSYNRFPG